jgi:hypothetical protein
MEHESFLQTIAQVGATFGGLAAVIAAFRGASENTGGVFVVRDVVEVSIMVTIASLVPYVFYRSGLSQENSWRVCCVILLFFAAFGGGASLRRSLDSWKAKPLYWGLIALGAALIASALALSAVGAYFVSADVAYLMVLVLMLFAAGLMFLSILLPDEGGEPVNGDHTNSPS